MGYVVRTPLNFSTFFLLFLMFSIIFMDMKKRLFVYHAIG